MTLAYDRTGSGDPLLLVHGLGATRHSWAPVLARLAETFDVITVDLPGFGASPALTEEPTPAALAAAVAGLLDELGLAAPHVAGNSLGGWVALELAKSGRARSVTALSPAGLWQGHTPRWTTVQIRTSHALARAGRPLVPRLLAHPRGRVLMMAGMHARPATIAADDAIRDALDFAEAPDFERVRRATSDRRFTGGQQITVPVTIAYGARDRLLVPRQNAALDQLPAHTRRVPLPGCGHVPMPDDPELVVRTIRQTAQGA